MSVIYCHDCDNYVDTDFDVEHLDECPFKEKEQAETMPQNERERLLLEMYASMERETQATLRGDMATATLEFSKQVTLRGEIARVPGFEPEAPAPCEHCGQRAA